MWLVFMATTLASDDPSRFSETAVSGDVLGARGGASMRR